MGILTIKTKTYNDKNEIVATEKMLEIDTIKESKRFIEETNFPASTEFVYSTFNENHVENTINLIKH